ncbi:MAG: NfeD family protein [Clostridia bacterium]|nr:NfeD family protein [Clostridia bacterium]
MWYIWLIAAGVFFVAEIITVRFLIFWLGIGALIAMLVSLVTNNLVIQVAAFVISSALLIFCTKPFVKKLTKNDKTVVTNAFSIIGKTGIVTKEINSSLAVGQIKVQGQDWSAKCEGDEVIAEGSEVEVTKIDGVKAVVRLVKPSTTISE